MPELPEVETIRLGLLPAMAGKEIAKAFVNRADLRRAFPKGFTRRLMGRTVADLSRRGKYLIAALDDGNSLIMHLGMSGSFRIEAPGDAQIPGVFHYDRGTDPRHDHVVFVMSDGTRIVYNDPRRFGVMDLVSSAGRDQSPLLSGLGIEPLGPEFSGDRLATAAFRRSTSVKALLLDQRIVAGLGNIYVCEALWRARVSPFRAASSLADGRGRPTAETARLAKAIKAVLADAIAAGGSSLRNYSRADGTLGAFQHRFSVYDREGERCLRRGCGGTMERVVQNGRSTFFCGTCQK